MPRAPVGDLSIAYDVNGTGDPVLMINGIGAPRGAWGLQVPFISERYQVITFDNRDVGETSPSVEIDIYGTEQLARDAAGLLDHLGIEWAHVVGASMGGCIAQQFAILFPKRTQSLTIICSWANVDPWLYELWQQWETIFFDRGQVEWARTTWLWVFTHRAYRDQNFLGGLLREADASPNPQTFEMYIRQSYAASTHNVVSQLPSVTAPAHVICGEEDIFTPPRYSVEIANAIPGARLTEMPEVGHGMFWEATDAFNALVRDFIDEHPITR